MWPSSEAGSREAVQAMMRLVGGVAWAGPCVAAGEKRHQYDRCGRPRSPGSCYPWSSVVDHGLIGCEIPGGGGKRLPLATPSDILRQSTTGT